MITDVTSPYLEKIRQVKARAEIKAGTIHLSETECLIPLSGGGYAHCVIPKHTRDGKIPIIYKRQK